jgi:hypothetical protein
LGASLRLRLSLRLRESRIVCCDTAALRRLLLLECRLPLSLLGLLGGKIAFCMRLSGRRSLNMSGGRRPRLDSRLSLCGRMRLCLCRMHRECLVSRVLGCSGGRSLGGRLGGGRSVHVRLRCSLRLSARFRRRRRLRYVVVRLVALHRLLLCLRLHLRLRLSLRLSLRVRLRVCLRRSVLGRRRCVLVGVCGP